MKLSVLETSATPNPHAIKFVVNARVTTKPRSFTSHMDASADTLAEELLAIPGITSVFYFDNFITLTKAATEDWPALMVQAKGIINSAELGNLTSQAREQLNQLKDSAKKPLVPLTSGALAGRFEEIAQLIESEIKKPLTLDGGGLDVISLEDNVLTVRYYGACGSCPSSTTTTLAFIQDTLRSRIDPRIVVRIES